MKIGIIGSGYIGLVTATCLAKTGHNIICADVNADKIDLLKTGVSPIFEPGLEDMISEMQGEGRLVFTTSIAETVHSSDVVFIAVGTPTAVDGKSSDLSQVFSAALEIAAAIKAFKIIVVKSTVPPGTVRNVGEAMKSAFSNVDFEIASNPEFLREGSAVFDFMNPDRIVLGVESMRARSVLDEVYAPWIEKNVAVLHTDFESAELVKFASNGFLAAKIAFINEMAEFCELVGANIQDVATGMGHDERIGRKFLNSGPGFGGSCFPKDTRALISQGRGLGIRLPIVEATEESNERTKLRMVQKVLALADNDLHGKTLAIFGVTFKAGTDDMREAPSLTILPELSKLGAVLRAVDPQGERHGAVLLPMVSWFEDPYEAAKKADMVVVLTEWMLFRNLDLKRLAGLMRTPVMADLRNIYTPEALRIAGFIGSGSVGGSDKQNLVEMTKAHG